MARLTPAPERHQGVFDDTGQDWYYLGANADIDPVNRTTLNIRGFELRRNLRQNDVKVRPTNTTATLLLQFSDTANQLATVYTEVILLHNGPQGGYNILPFLISDNYFPPAVGGESYDLIRVFVNGVVGDVLATAS